MPKPYRVSKTSMFRIKAKDLKKKHTITLGGHSVHVLTNTKNSYGERVITAVHHARGKKENFTIILPKNTKVDVRVHTWSYNPKNR